MRVSVRETDGRRPVRLVLNIKTIHFDSRVRIKFFRVHVARVHDTTQVRALHGVRLEGVNIATFGRRGGKYFDLHLRGQRRC